MLLVSHIRPSVSIVRVTKHPLKFQLFSVQLIPMKCSRLHGSSSWFLLSCYATCFLLRKMANNIFIPSPSNGCAFTNSHFPHDSGFLHNVEFWLRCWKVSMNKSFNKNCFKQHKTTRPQWIFNANFGMNPSIIFETCTLLVGITKSVVFSCFYDNTNT
jgi:hypothetical protein